MTFSNLNHQKSSTFFGKTNLQHTAPSHSQWLTRFLRIHFCYNLDCDFAVNRKQILLVKLFGFGETYAYKIASETE